MAKEKARKRDELHVLMFPWLAHGHISAYAELSTRLADNGVNVSFFSTPRNIAEIKPFFENRHKNSPYKGHIRLVDSPLPMVEGLPPEIESTAQLPIHLTPFFLKAVDGLEIPFEKLLEETHPDFVVFDFIQGWAGRSAAKFGIPAISFTTFGAAFTSYTANPLVRELGDSVTAEDLTHPPPGFPAPEIAWKLYEARHALQGYKGGEIGYNERMWRGIDGCSAIAVKSCEEIEEELIKYLENVTGKPVLPVGPLLPEFHPADADCLRWLDTQEQGSVTYVSFGSQIFLSREQILEVAAGLEANGHPFLWALRVHGSCHVSELLPVGFEERVGKRGMVTGEWVPQRSVLSHASTGSFLTHCGLNSVMEALSVGLPLIAAPMQFDQSQNARLVVEKLKAGVEIGRKNDGGFDRGEICRAVRIVMEKEEELGREVSRRARDIGEVFQHKVLSSGGSQESYVERFVEHLQVVKARATNPQKGSATEEEQSLPSLHC